jgi:hypothetical protein
MATALVIPRLPPPLLLRTPLGRRRTPSGTGAEVAEWRGSRADDWSCYYGINYLNSGGCRGRGALRGREVSCPRPRRRLPAGWEWREPG